MLPYKKECVMLGYIIIFALTFVYSDWAKGNNTRKRFLCRFFLLLKINVAPNAGSYQSRLSSSKVITPKALIIFVDFFYNMTIIFVSLFRMRRDCSILLLFMPIFPCD